MFPPRKVGTGTKRCKRRSVLALIDSHSQFFGPQVEYGPCVIAGDCWSLLLEFLQSFLGSHTPGAPAVFGNRHDAVYGPADTMVQYMELFNKIRKQQQVPVAGIR